MLDNATIAEIMSASTAIACTEAKSGCGGLKGKVTVTDKWETGDIGG